MAIYTVSYELKNHDSMDYSKLREAIESYGDVCRPLASTWLIRTNETALDIYNRLRRFIHEDDRILVMLSIVPGCFGWLEQDVCDWLDAHERV